MMLSCHRWILNISDLLRGALWSAVVAAVCVASLNCCGVQGQEPERERYVPAENLDTVIKDGAAGVMLPRAEFDALLKKAQDAQQSRLRQPAAVIIRSVDYQVRQEDVHAIVQMTLEIEQFVDGIVSLGIPVGHLHTESASIADQAARVGTVPGQPNQLTLIHDKAGQFSLKLVLSTPLGTAGTDRLAAIRLLPDIPASLTVECPSARHLEVNNLQLIRPAPLDQPATYKVPVGNNNEARLKWTARRQESEMQTLIFARTEAKARLSSDNLRWESETRVSVFGNSINQLVARVPATLEVTGVESSGLESWTLADDPQQAGYTRVVMNYRQPFQDDRIIKLSAVAPLSSATESKVPTFEFVEVTSHSGRLSVSHDDQLRLMATVGGGLRHLGNGVAATAGEIFDFWLQDYELAVAVRPRDRELFSQVNQSLTIVETTATFVCDLTVESLNDSLFELPLKLPTGWKIGQVTDGGGNRVKWRPGNSESEIVVEPAAAVSAGGLLVLRIPFTRTISDPVTEQTLDLPVLTAEGALTVGGTYEVSASGDLRITPLEISGLSPIGDEDGILLYETQGTTWAGKISVVRQPQRTASRCVIRSWMDLRQKTTEAVVTIDVLSGTIRSAEVSVPEDLGADVRFEVASIGAVPGLTQRQIPTFVAITEQNAAEPVDGSRVYSLTFDKRFAGALTLRAVVQQERIEDTVLKAAPFGLVGAVRQHGLVVFDAYPEQQLDAEDGTLSGLDEAGAGMVPAPSQDSGRRTALVYRYIQPDHAVTIAETRFDTQPVPSAVCQQMNNISVLSEAGSEQRSCTAYIRCVGVQTLRFSLPESEQTFLWSTVLNDEAVEVRRDGEDYIVAIPTDQGQVEHVLEILFQTAAESESVLGTELQQSVRFAIDTDDNTATSVDVLEQSWEIRFPNSSLLVSHDGGFEALSELDQPGWLRSLGGWVRFPSRQSAVERMIPVGVVLLVLFVVTTLIVRRRWKSLAAVCVLALVGFSLLLDGVGRQAEYADALATSEAYFGDDEQYMPQDSAADYENFDKYDAGIELSMEPMSNEMGSESRLNVPQMPGEEMAETEAAVPEQPAAADAPAAMPDLAGVPAGGEAASQTRAGGRMSRSGEDPFNGQQPASGALFGGMGGGGFGGGGAGSGFGGAISSNGAVPQQSQQGRQGQQEMSNEFFANESDALAGELPPVALTGAARLSVRADIASPDDYRSKQFRSVAAGSQSGDLRFVVQPQSTLSAMRVIAAAITLMLCLTALNRSVLQKFSLAIILLAVAIALVPLLRPALQTIADGVVLGTIAGIVVWLLRWSMDCVRKCWHCCCRIPFLKSENAATAAGAVLLCLATASPDAAAQDDPQKKDVLRPDVVLPYAPNGPAVLADRVFLPKDQFLQLYRAANPGALEGAPTKEQSGVVAAFYKSGTLQEAGDSWLQKFSARYVLHTGGSQPALVSLPIGLVALRSAKLDGSKAVITSHVSAPVPYEGGQQGQMPANQAAPAQQKQQARPALEPQHYAAYQVRVPEAGVHVLDLEFDVKTTRENSVGRVEIPLRSVATGTLQYELPADNLEVRVNGRSDALRTIGRTVTVPVSKSTGLRIEWQPKSTTAVADVVYHSTVNSALVIDDAGLTVRSTVLLNSRQGQLSEVSVRIPADYAVQKVEGEMLSGWNVLEGEYRQLKLLFRQAIDKETSVNLTLFQRKVFSTNADLLDVPVLAVSGASRDSGNVTVIAGRELDIRVNSLSGVSQINAGESRLPAELDNKVRRVLAWRYTRHPAQVSIRASRTADRMVTRILNGVQVDTQRQLWTTLVSTTITGSPRRRLEIVLPADFVVLDVSANELADWYMTEGQPDTDTRILNIQFQSARIGTVSAVIQSQLGTDELGDQTILKAPQILNSDEVTTNLSLWLDASVAYKGAASEGWKRATSSSPVDARLLQLKPTAPSISFLSTESAPGPITVTLGRKPVTLTPESVSVTNVADTSLELTLGLHWRIDNATRELSFTLPERLTDVFDFRIPGLRQLETGTPENGRVLHTIRLQQPVTGKLFVIGTGTLPLPESNQISADPPEFVAEEGGVVTLAPQSHFWIIVNQSGGLLEPVDPDVDGEDIAPDEIQLPAGILQQSVAMRRLRSDRQNSPWRLTFPVRQQVSPAVVALAAHTTVIADDGTWRSRHELEVLNESRQFLPVNIPEGSRFLYCLVKGRPARVVTRTIEERVMHMIPVPQAGEVATPIDVEFALAGAMELKRIDINGTDLNIPVPTFPEFRDDPEFGITVSRNKWSVLLPESWQASLQSNPRQTNVIRANEQDLEDVELLSVVDTTNSMINAYNSNKGRSSITSLYTELSRKESMLQVQRGNTLETEQQRETALRELSDQLVILEQQIADPQNAGSQSGQAAINPFLESIDSDNNAFNYANNNDLYFSNNAPSGVTATEQQDLRFNFVVPVEPQTSKPLYKSESGAKAVDGKGLAGKKSEKKSAPAKRPENRSKLLGNRGQNLKQQSERVQSKLGAIQELINQNADESDFSSAVPQFAPQMFDGSGNEPNFGGQIDSNSIQQDNTLSLVTADQQGGDGLLSLEFDIPDAGVRHDFVRTGGNAMLTLTVRGRDSIGTGLNLLWAAGCFFVAVILLKARSFASLASRICIVAAVAGLLGWLFLAQDAGRTALLICLLSAAAFCVLLIVRTFRRPNPVPE